MCLLKRNIISIRATEVNLVIKKIVINNSKRMKLSTIFDHCVFAKEMKMGNIQIEYFTLGLQSKNKGSFAQYLWNYLEKILLIRGRPPFQKLVPRAKASKTSLFLPYRAFFHISSTPRHERRMKIKNLSIFESLLNDFAIYCLKMVTTFENKKSGIFQSNETEKKSENYRLL